MKYVCKNNVCIPRDIETVWAFKALQRAINDVLTVSVRSAEGSTGEINPKLALYIKLVPISGQIDATTAMTASDLALNIKRTRDAFYGILLDQPAIAKYAVELGRWFTVVAGTKYDAEAVPKWMWPMSPAAALAWVHRSY